MSPSSAAGDEDKLDGDAPQDELLRRALAGDYDALDALVVRAVRDGRRDAHRQLVHFARVHLARVARRHLRDPGDDPDSMAQAGALELLKRPLALQNASAAAFLAYLDRMAHNWACTRQRRRDARAETSLGGESEGHRKPPPEAADALPVTISAERFEFLLSRCADEAERTVLRERFEQRLEYDRIGQQMTPPRTADAVRMQVTRALIRLGNDPDVRRESEQ